MRLGLAGVLADAWALWRRGGHVQARVAAVFFFLPSLAFLLFVAPPATQGLAEDAAARAVLQWYAANVHWQLGQALFQLFGSAVLFVLLLDPHEQTVGDAFVRAARMFPALLLNWLATTAIVVAGLLCFVVPGAYAVGRTYVSWPVLVAEPQRGPMGALGEAVRRSRGCGWMLLLISLVPLLAMFFSASLLAELRDAMQSGGAPSAALTLIHFAAAFVGAVGTLAQVLLQTAAYRRLAVPRQGI